MISTFLGAIATSPLVRAILRYGVMALAIVLFLLSICRTGERAGQAANCSSPGENS